MRRESSRKSAARSWPERRVRDLFAAIDDKDVGRFLAFLAPDARFRFGNGPPCHGHAAIGESVSGFFSAIRSCSHELEASWRHPDSVICHGRVSYTRLDGSLYAAPFANVLLLRDGLVVDYLIFADVSGLFGPQPGHG